MRIGCVRLGCMICLCVSFVALAAPVERQSVRFARLDREARAAKLAGEYALALRLYDEALSIPASNINLNTVALNKSDLLIQTGLNTEAEKLLLGLKDLPASLEIRRINNLASVYAQMKRVAEAKELFSNALQKDDIDITTRSRILQNYGFLLMSEGEWQSAVSKFEESIKSAGQESVDYPIILSNMALAESFAGMQPEAEKDIIIAYKLLCDSKGDSHPDAILALRKMGEIFLKGGKVADSSSAFQKFYESERLFLQKSIRSMNEQQRLDYWNKEKESLALIFGLEENAPDLIFDVGLFRRNISFGSKFADEKKTLSLKGPDIQKRLTPLEALVDFAIYLKRNDKGELIEYLGASVVRSNKVEFISLGSVDSFRKQKIGNTNLKEALKSQRSAVLNSLYADVNLKNRIWEPILNILPGINNIYFIPDGFIHTLGVEYLEGLPKDITFHRLTSPVELKTQSALIPNEEMLFAGGFDFNRIPSVENKDRDVAGMVGNHNASEFLKSNIGLYNFRNLSGTGREVDEISGIAKNPLIRYDIAEEDLENILSKCGRVHIATHGYALHIDKEEGKFMLEDSLKMDRSMLASGLVLSGANLLADEPARADGLVSAREFCDYNLPGVELFVLSACSTADGEVIDEGPAGLIRGLKRAGVKTVIATLWEVDDEAAVIFMKKFYELMKAGKSVRIAFGEAQKYLREYEVEYPEVIEEYNPATMTSEYIETGNMEKEQPYCNYSSWAPFILIDGD